MARGSDRRWIALTLASPVWSQGLQPEPGGRRGANSSRSGRAGRPPLRRLLPARRRRLSAAITAGPRPPRSPRSQVRGLRGEKTPPPSGHAPRFHTPSCPPRNSPTSILRLSVKTGHGSISLRWHRKTPPPSCLFCHWRGTDQSGIIRPYISQSTDGHFRNCDGEPDLGCLVGCGGNLLLFMFTVMILDRNRRNNNNFQGFHACTWGEVPTPFILHCQSSPRQLLHQKPPAFPESYQRNIP